jgi:uncharacterized membrane protein
MSDPDRLSRFLRTKLQGAGKQYEEARRAFREARSEAVAELPTDDGGKARLVCRRFAEQRAVEVDAGGKPACFEADHPDCEGCVEDIREGRIETW